MKQFLEAVKYYQDYFLFSMIMFVGLFYKMYNAQQTGKKITFAYVLAEGLTYAFVGYTAHVVLDQFFNVSSVFDCIISAWIGSKSSIINVKVEELINTGFKKINDTIKTK